MRYTPPTTNAGASQDGGALEIDVDDVIEEFEEIEIRDVKTTTTKPTAIVQPRLEEVINLRN